jgi:hypothetical protein
MIGKLVPVMIALILSATASASENAQICISREESGGVLNIRPAQITANEKHLFWIAGGERKCAEVEPGQYGIIAQSSDPYDPNDKNPATWRSKPLIVSLQAGAKVEITVFPVSQGAAYVGPWELKR